MKTLLALTLALFSVSTFADQCSWNKRTDAKSALKLLKNNDIILWCQNCGESRPSNIFKVLDVKLDKPANEYYDLTVRAEYNVQPIAIDLAYTYVRTASDVFTNVAHLVGCPSQGATTFVQTGPGSRKVAHFYNKQGVRVDVATKTDELKVSEYTTFHTDRMPASKK